MGPVIFFLVIIGIDLFLKSAKDKKKIEEVRIKKMQELKNKENIKTTKPSDSRVKREIPVNPSISRHLEKDNFFGEGKNYKENHKGYQERYENRYDNIEKEYNQIKSSYKDKKLDRKSQSLYDPNAIQNKDKKQSNKLDFRDYEKESEKIQNTLPKASTFKEDVLKGIIFSEILGKPKSLQKK